MNSFCDGIRILSVISENININFECNDSLKFPNKLSNAEVLFKSRANEIRIYCKEIWFRWNDDELQFDRDKICISNC